MSADAPERCPSTRAREPSVLCCDATAWARRPVIDPLRSGRSSGALPHYSQVAVAMVLEMGVVQVPPGGFGQGATVGLDAVAVPAGAGQLRTGRPQPPVQECRGPAGRAALERADQVAADAELCSWARRRGRRNSLRRVLAATVTTPTWPGSALGGVLAATRGSPAQDERAVSVDVAGPSTGAHFHLPLILVRTSPRSLSVPGSG
jgi:hypothetical protein